MHEYGSTPKAPAEGLPRHEEEPMPSAQVTDLYQASFLLLSGCELTGVECIPTAGAVSCALSFSSANIEELLDAWWNKEALVNLWSFRSAYSQINSYVHQAKKSYDQLKRHRG